MNLAAMLQASRPMTLVHLSLCVGRVPSEAIRRRESSRDARHFPVAAYIGGVSMSRLRRRRRSESATSRLRVLLSLFVGSLVGLLLLAPTAGASARFQDVPENHRFFEAVEWMADQEITLGCDWDGTLFCPDGLVTRGQMASFLSRTFYFVDGEGSDRFTDDDGLVHEENIERLAHAEVTLGCNVEGTLFCPRDLVTREQMASFLVRALGLAPVPGDRFDDVFGTHEPNVNALADAGITLGCNAEGTLFCPRDPVRRDHMSAFLWRAFGEPLVGSPGVNRVDGTVAVVVGDDDVTSGSANEDGKGRWIFAADADRLPHPGEIVIMDATGRVPTGILGKVVSVTEQADGSQMVVTDPVPLQAILSRCRPSARRKTPNGKTQKNTNGRL